MNSNIQSFRTNNEMRRSWVYRTLLLEVPDNIHLASPDTYCFNEMLTVMNEDETNPWWCDKAIFKIQQLIDIKNSQSVEMVVDCLLEL